LIEEVVIPAAGLGTRLLSATKEQPKEMLPVFAINENGSLGLKPLLQLLFEQLYNFGVRRFCFVVGREKRAVEDHFTPDYEYTTRLKTGGKNEQAASLVAFYEKVRASAIQWVNQYEPLGFGDAVLQAEPFIHGESFLVHAGDTYVISQDNTHLNRLVSCYRDKQVDAVLTLLEVDDPRNYGVADVSMDGSDLIVKSVVEKPDQPKTKLAIMPIYAFNRSIFKALRVIGPGKAGEMQLTDGIQKLIEWGHKVRAVKLHDGEVRLDIGTPDNYWEAQSLCYEYFKKISMRPGR
jgi:UTP--glucose-1-phosphate uridylyltransferase